jgi:hypothetical protein
MSMRSEITFGQRWKVRNKLLCIEKQLIGANKSYDRLPIATASEVNESSDTPIENDARESLVGYTIGIDRHRCLVFGPLQYVTIRESIQASNRPCRTTNYPQISLRERPQIQGGSYRTLINSWGTGVLTLANEAIDLSFQGGWSFVGRRLPVRETTLRSFSKNPRAPWQISFHLCSPTGEEPQHRYATISRIFTPHLGLTKFSRRWAPHDLTDDQKHLRCKVSERLLNAAGFSQVAIRDESQFSCHFQSTYFYVESHAAVPPRTKTMVIIQRAGITIFFTGTKFLTLHVIPCEERVNQNYVLVIPLIGCWGKESRLRQNCWSPLTEVFEDGRLNDRNEVCGRKKRFVRLKLREDVS